MRVIYVTSSGRHLCPIFFPLLPHPFSENFDWARPCSRPHSVPTTQKMTLFASGRHGNEDFGCHVTGFPATFYSDSRGVAFRAKKFGDASEDVAILKIEEE
jgi:hypothetical protein